MESFYRPGIPAVGTCKHCQRGLDRESLAEFDYGLACKDRCEEAVHLLHRLIERNIRMSSTRASRFIGYGFLIMLSLSFIGWGIYAKLLPVTSIGAIYLIYSLSSLLLERKRLNVQPDSQADRRGT